ncbi:transposon Ty3-G Gag-Pol polyprotein [Trichonephila clavipes]|nr:transposon Ty3-G Gag-Pol polyprotein [Trichonephila clavipes]
MDDSGSSVLCDTSMGVIRPNVPKTLRRKVFDVLHGNSYSGVRATVDLIRKRYFWPSLRKDCAIWTKSCLRCQHSRVQRHVHAPVGNYDLPLERFRFIHIDIVGPLPSSRCYTFCLTYFDGYTRWPEAFSMTNQTAETVAETFFSGWTSRYGVPESIVTDRSKNFESDLFYTFSNSWVLKREGLPRIIPHLTT